MITIYDRRRKGDKFSGEREREEEEKESAGKREDHALVRKCGVVWCVKYVKYISRNRGFLIYFSFSLRIRILFFLNIYIYDLRS